MAKTKVGNLLSNLFDQFVSTGGKVVTDIKTDSQANAMAAALALVFGGKPDHMKLENGKTLFYWQGEELPKAQSTVLKWSKGNPNSTVSVDLSPVVFPAVARASLPVLALISLYMFAKGKK